MTLEEPRGPRTHPHGPKILGPVISWILESPGSSMLLGPIGFSRVVGLCFPVSCYFLRNNHITNYRNNHNYTLNPIRTWCMEVPCLVGGTKFE